MPNTFAKIAFTTSVKETQSHYGSRFVGERYENIERPDELTDVEIAFIDERDGFYIATVNQDGHPYVQFRGGPKGFLKTLSRSTLAYADFRGNLQYISVGNLRSINKVALILMNYAARTRLKIFADVEVIDAAKDPRLIAELTMPGYQAKAERAILLHVKAFDWNCPQHITQRYTVEEINAMNAGLVAKMDRLELENAHLRAELASRQSKKASASTNSMTTVIRNRKNPPGRVK